MKNKCPPKGKRDYSEKGKGKPGYRDQIYALAEISIIEPGSPFLRFSAPMFGLTPKLSTRPRARVGAGHSASAESTYTAYPLEKAFAHSTRGA